jgi:hypothetical protein
MKSKFLAAFFLVFSFFSVAAQEKSITFEGRISWEKMELDAESSLELASHGIRLPTGRSRADILLDTEFPRLVQPHLLAIPVDSSSTLGSMVDSGEISLQFIGGIASSAKRLHTALSEDLCRLTSSYKIDLRAVSSQLIRHSRAAEPGRALNPVPAGPYTGIIIIADGELPVHGRSTSAYLSPCLFPKIWDSEMNLFFERNMVSPQTARSQGIVRYTSRDKILAATPSTLDAGVAALVGPKPLRIIARGVYGALPTDPIIEREDALVILSSPENRRLLQEGKVVLVIRREALN